MHYFISWTFYSFILCIEPLKLGKSVLYKQWLICFNLLVSEGNRIMADDMNRFESCHEKSYKIPEMIF